MNSNRRFSQYIQNQLEEAGWYPGRDVQEKIKFPEEIEMLPSALKIIAEFGNLQIGKGQSKQPGINVSRALVWIDPAEVYFWEEYEFAREIIGEDIYPIGLVDYDNSAVGDLYVNKAGYVFRIDDIN